MIAFWWLSYGLLWMLAAAAVVLILRGWRGRRHGDALLCRRCGYDLRGLTAAAATCPECGAAIHSAHAMLRGRHRRNWRTVTIGLLLLVGSITGLFVLQHFYRQQRVQPHLMMRAVEQGDADAVSLLVARYPSLAQGQWAGVDANWPTDETPLTLAASRGYDDMVRSLIAAGANVNQLDARGQSALHAAVEMGRVDMLQMLLDAGGDVHATSSRKRSVLHLAVLASARPGVVESMIPMLLAAGADPNARDVDGRTPVHDAAAGIPQPGAVAPAQPGQLPAALPGTLPGVGAQIIGMLAAAGADVNLVNNLGNAPLHLAVDADQPAAVDALIAAGADVNMANRTGDAPLHLAVRHGDFEAVKLLLAAGAEVDRRNTAGRSPLELATTSTDQRIVQALLDAGARATPTMRRRLGLE